MTTSSEPAAAAAPVLRAAAASFSYGATPALSGIDLTLLPGRALALIGPNGAGKSTLLKGVLGLVKLSAGTLEVGGTDARRSAERGRGGIGYLPQSGLIDPEFPVTVRQVVMMGRYRSLPWWRFPNRADRAAVRRALELVGLEERAGARFGTLSGGQRQRVLLARAIVADPRLLLLDEPFNGLDQANRDALLTTLRTLKQQGVAVLVSTHDVSLAREVCEDVLLLDGHPVRFGSVDEVLTDAVLAEAFRGDTGLVVGHDAHDDHRG